MLLVLAAVIVPLLVLILARLLEKLMPSLAALVSALLVGLALLPPIGLLAYDTKPGTNSTEVLKLSRYGRTA